MEENKNLVISYSYFTEKISAEEAEVSNRVQEIIKELASNGSINQSMSSELEKLVHIQCELAENRRITVYKEYPEFLVEGFKAKEELFDFIDEDEPMILKENDILFENVPECLKQIGIFGTHDDCLGCKEFIEKKHGCWEGQQPSFFIYVPNGA